MTTKTACDINISSNMNDKSKWDDESWERKHEKNKIGLWIVISIEFSWTFSVSNTKDNLTMNTMNIEQHEKRSQNKYPNDSLKKCIQKWKFNCSIIICSI